MAILYINARCRQILGILLNQTQYMTIDQLAKRLNISKRSAYYDICKINVWLEQMHVHPLEVERGHGLFIPKEDRSCIETFLAAPSEKDVYIFSPEERVKLIILQIIQSEEPVFMEQLMACCDVSRSTIFSDLKEITAQLKHYDLNLLYQPKTGYVIEGDPIRIRALFILYFRELLPLYQSGLLRAFQQEPIDTYYTKLKQLEGELESNYVDGILLSIAAVIPLAYRHEHPFSFPGLNIEQLKQTHEFQLVCKYFPDLIEDETIYLTLHLLGSRTTAIPQNILEDVFYQNIADIVTALVSEFERVACVNFDDRASLERALYAHLKTSIYRYQFGVQIGDLLCDDIKQEYPELFSITKIAAKRLEQTMELPIPDEEVAFLALHFGAFLKIAETDNEHLRILIVCVNGISTGNMIKREVQKLLPYAEIVDVVAAVDVHNAQNICNLIISTIKINSVVPSITVHPVLTAFDRASILNHRVVVPKRSIVKRDALFQTVKKYVDPSNYEALLADLSACLSGEEIFQPSDIKADCGLLHVLNASRVCILDEAKSWQDAIRAAGKCLLDSGSVQKRYLDTIISHLHYYGPYMFLTEDVILAHAKPEDGVNCLDLSLAIFQKPVRFSAQRHAKLIFVLAAEDQEKHLKILQDILELISNPESIQLLAACDHVDKVLLLIRSMLHQETS